MKHTTNFKAQTTESHARITLQNVPLKRKSVLSSTLVSKNVSSVSKGHNEPTSGIELIIT
jgi:hypothetical protein